MISVSDCGTDFESLAIWTDVTAFVERPTGARDVSTFDNDEPCSQRNYFVEMTRLENYDDVVDDAPGAAVVDDVVDDAPGATVVDDVVDEAPGAAVVDDVVDDAPGAAVVDDVVDEAPGAAVVDDVVDETGGTAGTGGAAGGACSTGGISSGSILSGGISSGGIFIPSITGCFFVRRAAPAPQPVQSTDPGPEKAGSHGFPQYRKSSNFLDARPVQHPFSSGTPPLAGSPAAAASDTKDGKCRHIYYAATFSYEVDKHTRENEVHIYLISCNHHVVPSRPCHIASCGHCCKS